jgi:hypothetical protein
MRSRPTSGCTRHEPLRCCIVELYFSVSRFVRVNRRAVRPTTFSCLMHQTFFTDPVILAASVAVLALVNYRLALLTIRRRALQSSIAYEPLPGEIASPRTRFALPFISAVPAMILAFAPGVPQAIFAGGYIIMQAFGIALSVATALSIGSLRAPHAAEGQVRFSAVYQYRHHSSYIVGFALFAALIAVLSQSLEFLGAFLWLSATSLGYLRRARQAERAAAV